MGRGQTNTSNLSNVTQAQLSGTVQPSLRRNRWRRIAEAGRTARSAQGKDTARQQNWDEKSFWAEGGTHALGGFVPGGRGQSGG